MRLLVRKDFADELKAYLGRTADGQIDDLTPSLEKSHKYISRWFKNGKWEYEYPSNQKKDNGRGNAKNEIALKTKVITGIKPLINPTEKEIDIVISELKELSDSGKLNCPALGNENIYIIDETKSHAQKTGDTVRTPEATNHKFFYLPFVEQLLKNGKISEKSYRKNNNETKRLTYGIIGRVEYRNEEQVTVKENVEIAVGYDSEKRKYVLSFANYKTKNPH